MNKQKTNPNNRRFQRVPMRARLGLAMRRSMSYGELGDIEPVLQGQGLALAPISTGDATLSINGVTVMATAKVADVENGSVAGLVLPDTDLDEAANDQFNALVKAALDRGVPILAFGGAIADAARVMGARVESVAGMPAAVIGGEDITPVRTREQLALVASTLGQAA